MPTNNGCVIWITGMSGAGKSTLADILKTQIQRQYRKNVVLLDGDELRKMLCAENHSYDFEGRRRLAFTYARLCRLLAEQGCIVVCATISLFHDVHEWNRGHLPNYFEIFLDVPECELRKRDSKKLYANQDTAIKQEIAGVDVDAEFPKSPDMRVCWDPAVSAHDVADRVMSEMGGFISDMCETS